MRLFCFVLLSCAIFPCQAQQSAVLRDTFPGEIITIPVVVHVLYNDNTKNISDAQVLSQIESLNKDYRKLNNTSNIPVVFSSLAADVKINFCLAKTDPQGKATSGIIHKYTPIARFNADDEMKFSASGGDNAWDPKRYLNLWVCDLYGSLGYSSLPGSPADKDGVVIRYDAFGTTGSVKAPFDKGRTATHEIGHWLGLKHLWGDALCGDDKIDDTPPQRTYNNGCPSFPHVSTCSINANGDMFMNFMDFTDDACMSMFTHGQKKKMRSMFALGNARNSFLQSTACNNPVAQPAPVLAEKTIAGSTVSIYPVPAGNFINIEAKNSNELTGGVAIIYDMAGKEVKRQLLNSAKNTISLHTMAAGTYVVKINGKETMTMMMVKE